MKKTVIFDYIFWLILWFSIIWGANLPSLKIGNVSFFPARFLSLLLLLFYLYKNKLKLYIDKTDIFGIFFIICGFIAIIWTIDISRSITYISVYIICFSIFFLTKKIVNNEEEIKIVNNTYMINIFVMCLLGIYESVTGNYIIVRYSYYLYRKNIFGLYMPSVGLYNINNYATVMSLSLPFLYLFCKQNKINKFVELIISLLIFFSIILTGSRTGYFVVFIYIIYRFCQIEEIEKKILIILSAVIVIFYLFLLYYNELSNLANSALNLSNETRLIIWKATLKGCEDYIFGSGPGTSIYLVEKYCNLFLPPHNFILEIMCEFGVFGVISFIYIVTKTLIGKVKNSATIYNKTSALFFIILLLCSICPSSLYDFYVIWALLGFLYIARRI